jgi:iron complex transport system substrate-binding protein
VLPSSNSRWRLLGAILTALFLLTSCSGGTSRPSAGPSADGAFPVTVTHKFGTTEIRARPQRVVSLGYTDQDAILALGVVPVAIREFTGQQPSATWPWAQSMLQGQKPEVLPAGEVSTEAIAALRPDLIVGISAGLTREQYETYSRIAPVVAAPEQYVDYGTPWQDVTRMVGTALGKAPEADELVTDLEARFAAARAQYPALAGKSVAGVRPSAADSSNYFVWGSQDLRARFFSSLGMTVPPEFDRLAGDSFYATISTEELSRLDTADVVVLITAGAQERATFEALPGYSALKDVREGRVLAPDDRQSAALSFSSVLSLPELLDAVPAQLAKVVTPAS